MPLPVKIDFAGDSTMYGSVLTPSGYGVSPYRIPSVVQELMGTKAICRNIAIGGSTTQEWLYGQGNVSMPWSTRMTNTDASIIVLNTGINDVFVPSMTSAIYEYQWREIHRITLEAGKTLVCVTPNPIYYFPHVNFLWEYQNVLKNAAVGFGLPVIDLWNAIVAMTPDSWPALLPDNIHPGDDLYRVESHIVYIGLKKFIPYG